MEAVIDRRAYSPVKVWVKALRVHQWSKNVLIFLPMLVAHYFFRLDVMVQSVFAFISFSLAASSGYILNDILDIEADRQHPIKSQRPFASELLSVNTGIVVLSVMIFSSFFISIVSLPILFSTILIIYVVTTAAYSLFLKSKALVDVVTLAILYTLRIIAGGTATSILISSWLLVFSMFFFLSLAFMKRYADLVMLQRTHRNSKVRGYLSEDFEIVRSAGICSGYISILVLVFYIYSDHVTGLYKQPVLLWLVVPLLLYWLSRMWLWTHRGRMDTDPVVFALKDSLTYVIGIVVAAILIWAKFSDGLWIDKIVIM